MGFRDESLFSGTDDTLVRDVLREYGELTRKHMQAYLPQDEPQVVPLRAARRLSGTWRQDASIQPLHSDGACHRRGIEDAIPSAVSIELVHNALLVHDDIEDASDERRGTPTLHALHGIPLAINAGDAMGLLSLRPLKDNFHRLGLATGAANLRGNRTHGLGERRRPGARARLATRQSNRYRGRGLSADGPAEDLLARGDLSDAGGLPHRRTRSGCRWTR